MCGSAAASLTHPLGSTSSVAGGEARLSASPAATSNGSYQSSMTPSSSRAIRSSMRRKFPYCSAFGSSLSHSLAAVPMRISRPVLNRNAPSARARATTIAASCRLSRVGANVTSSGRPASRGAAGGMGLGERGAEPLLRIDVLRVAVEAHLDRADRQTGEPGGDVRVEALAVGLDLERHAGAPESLCHGEEVRHDQRLTAAEHHVGHTVADDIGDEPHRLGFVELVPQLFPGCGLGAAMKAAEVAIAGELPRHEERRPQAIDEVHTGHRTPQVKRSTATM